MESRRPLQLQLVLLLFALLSLCMLPAAVAGAGDNAKITCIERERQALLKIKDDLVDNNGMLSSWGSEDEKRDCCKWRRVGCNNRTGHVTILDLHGSWDWGEGEYLEGKISRSLLELQNLIYLDLSFNDFGYSNIPDFIGSLGKLEYLGLYYSNFVGTLPYQLRNLSNLRSLDIGCDYGLIGSDYLLKNVGKLEWLSNLSSLTHLYMSSVNLGEAIDWTQTIKMHPSLTHLRLSYCNLPNISHTSLSLKNSSTSSLTVLDLSFNYHLSSSIYPWLFNFSSTLVDLDLSVNLFQGPIPKAFGNFISLARLNFSDNQLQGPIPEAFGNMISLVDVDLSENKLEGGIPNSFENLCSLQKLDLSWNNLIEEISEFVQKLSGCLKDSLEILILNGNEISGLLPDFSRFSALRELYLYGIQLNGSLPKTYAFPSKLIVLDLEANHLIGPLPENYIKRFSSIRKLYLGYNKLNGTLPESLGQLSTLEELDISWNSFHGTVTKTHLLNLPNLKHLDLSFNSLNLNLSFGWVPKFQLNYIAISSCKLGGRFPLWLRTQKHLSYIDISYAEISDSIPNWFSALSTNLSYLNLSCNSLQGKLQNFTLKLHNYLDLDLSDNHFEGTLPLQLFSNVKSLNLSKNKFSGSLSFLCAMTNTDHFYYLDLSYNQLSGKLPDCWQNFESLVILVLANNNLSGNIPQSVGSLREIESLHLQNNSFSGVLPAALRNCTNLRFVDLGENRFFGNIPSWIGESMSSLVVFRLRSNLFNGSIPLQLCHQQSIQFLDLSTNNISGSIPWCLQNLTAMSHKEVFVQNYGFPSYSKVIGTYIDNLLVVWKGREFEYKTTLNPLKVIDLSSNRLVGEIPIEITTLSEMVALNLSGNNLTGLIPLNIGQLKMLESLDLSRNRLSGDIPTSLSGLSFLSHLDLSNNSLSGRIPLSTQLQSFNASTYMGNDGLCGLPLPNKCPGDEATHVPPIPSGSKNSNTQEDKQGPITTGFYANMGLGFATGFWGVCGCLMLNHSWRYAYFRFLNDVRDKFYILVIVSWARIQRHLQN